MTVAKALASGFPLSAVTSSKGIMNRWELGAHGTTFGGNPVSCAAAGATLQAIREEGLLQRAEATGERALAFLEELASKHPCIGEVRGKGCMIGVEFVDANGAADGRLCGDVLEECFVKGLLLIGCGVKRNVARFMPPLNVTTEELEEGLAIFATALGELG
jgi:4-aminobutyrate aminotransferase